MNPFKSLTLSFWQLGLFKLCMVALGIILGVYFKEFLMPLIVPITIAFIVPALYLFLVWWKQ
ncbi:MAG: hypothetical protein WAV21_00855 [Minisyncoccia bacterium]